MGHFRTFGNKEMLYLFSYCGTLTALSNYLGINVFQHVVEEKALLGGVVLLTLIYCTVSCFSVKVFSFPSPSLSSLFVMWQWHNKVFPQTNNVCQTCPEKYLVNLFHLQFVSFRCVPSSTTNGFERHQIQLSNLIHYHLMIAAGI